MRLPNFVNKLLSKKMQKSLKEQTGIENNIQFTELDITRRNGKTQIFASGAADLDVKFKDIKKLLKRK